VRPCCNLSSGVFWVLTSLSFLVLLFCTSTLLLGLPLCGIGSFLFQLLTLGLFLELPCEQGLAHLGQLLSSFSPDCSLEVVELLFVLGLQIVDLRGCHRVLVLSQLSLSFNKLTLSLLTQLCHAFLHCFFNLFFTFLLLDLGIDSALDFPDFSFGVSHQLALGSLNVGITLLF